MKTKMTLIAMQVLLLTACGGGGGSDSGAGSSTAAASDPAASTSTPDAAAKVDSPYTGSYVGNATYVPKRTYSGGRVVIKAFKLKDLTVKVSKEGIVAVESGNRKGQAKLFDNEFQMKLTGLPSTCKSGSTVISGKIEPNGKITGKWDAKFSCEEALGAGSTTKIKYTDEENGSFQAKK